VQPFSYRHASTSRDASGLMAEPASLVLACGTDLLAWMQKGLTEPRSPTDSRYSGLRRRAREFVCI
jgi:CO/xanthine dehydrogenase FAD-binding subunit